MSDFADSRNLRTVTLTAAEREWIRRQGRTARALADVQRQVRARLSRTEADMTRVREQLRYDRRHLEPKTHLDRPLSH